MTLLTFNFIYNLVMLEPVSFLTCISYTGATWGECVGDWEVPICINSIMWCGVIREMKIVRKPIMGG